MNLYHDKQFQHRTCNHYLAISKVTLEFNGTESVTNGERIYVQSSIEMTEQYKGLRTRLVSCVAKPDEGIAADMTHSWSLIDNGCILDNTVEMMPRGAKDQMRFSFQSFAFVMAPERKVSRSLFRH